MDDAGRELVVRDRWGRGFPVGGGWAITFLAAPPTPHEVKTASFDDECVVYKKCDCGNGCDCPKSSYGCSCASVPPVVFGQCVNGRCGVPVVVDATKDGWIAGTDGAWLLYDRGTLKGQWDDRGWHEAAAGGVLVETKPLPEGIELPNRFLTGVDSAKVPKVHKYSLNGQELPQHVAFSALDSPLDDTSRWHLAFKGDAKTLLAAKLIVEALPADVRAKLNVQYYDPSTWQAKELGAAVTLKAPTSTRFSKTLGTSDLLDDVLKLLALPGGPLWVEPVAPVTPPDAPVAPVVPAQTPWVAIVGALIAIWLWLKRKVSHE